ncbi:MAG: MoaD/ThiS family protein [Pseudomonadales bacterium]
MTVRVLFFASLREAVGAAQRDVALADGASLEELLIALRGVLTAPALTAISAENVRIAVNQTLASGPVRLHDGDEVAFLPPVTGG